jgi:D-glycero-alpha-D-manno-heptose-7-phosphate kinase
MIIVRSPLRVSLLGGGTDLPAFYSKSNGSVISFALGKYIYITINELAESDDILLKYSKLERVQNIDEIQHPIVRSALKRFEVSGVDISVTSDIPAGTGLGSSSSFTVGLVKALSEYKGIALSPSTLAEIACDIELNDLKEPIGKQDQYAASYGGINHFVFHQNGEVTVAQLTEKTSLQTCITESCLLLRVGTVRKSSSILADQSEKLESGLNFDLMSSLAEITEKFCSELPQSVETLGSLLTESWGLKTKLAEGITNQEIEFALDSAIKFGARGGKLLGAGQSGYILLVFPDRRSRDEYIEQLPNKNTAIMPRIDYDGCKVIFRSEKHGAS